MTEEFSSRTTELTRMFSNELADRDNLLNFFNRGVDRTETGSIVVDDAADVGTDDGGRRQLTTNDAN